MTARATATTATSSTAGTQTALQAALDSCDDFDSCTTLHFRPDDEASQCGLANLTANLPYVQEQLLGVLPVLSIGSNSPVVNVNAYDAVNTYTAASPCSTLPQVDYSGQYLPTANASSTPSWPAGAILVQAGASTLSCPQSFERWQPDAAFVTGGSTSGLSAQVSVLQSPRGAALTTAERSLPLLLSNRYGDFTYSIPVPTAGQWSLRLLFAENYWNSIGSRVFNVTAQGVTIISRLDLNTVGPNPTVPATAGSRGGLTQTTAYVFAGTINVAPASLAVELGFVSIVDNAIVSAVELQPLNSGALPSSTGPARPAPARSSSSTVTSSRSSSTGAASGSGFTLYINSGGSTGFTDGSGRQWQADAYYNAASEVWSGTPNGGAAWTNTSTDLFPLYDSNRYNNIAYRIPVPAAGSYGLLLHYAEMYWTTVGKRVFSVAVQGVTQIASLDLIAVTGHEYAAYVTAHTATVNASRTLSIQLTNIADNALLSGIELRALQ